MDIKSKVFPLHVLPDGQFMVSDQNVAFGEHRPSHRINFYAMVWFAEDMGVQYIDFEPYPIQKDIVYLISRNQVHSIPSDQLPKSRVIVFSEEFFHRIEELQLRQLFLPFENKGIAIPPEMTTPLEALFSLILLEYSGIAEINLLLKYTTIFLHHLHRLGTHKLRAVAGDDLRIVKLFQLMEENFKEKRSASFYSEQIGLTPKRINEILRVRAGITMSQLLSQLVLIESKRELFHGEFSIKEIAFNLGFADQSYFARFFKKQTGITPEQFKRNVQQQLLNARP
ncbi:MAG TPA: helix-turn-helix domain-containing protein [Dyadobacter sp.]|jgi:AraC-like DNA-binding protein|nr:helix-turn-helix domain-containing protein [Dyadobacter sp.]